jgi:hypothetical protein
LTIGTIGWKSALARKNSFLPGVLPTASVTHAGSAGALYAGQIAAHRPKLRLVGGGSVMCRPFAHRQLGSYAVHQIEGGWEILAPCDDTAPAWWRVRALHRRLSGNTATFARHCD